MKFKVAENVKGKVCFGFMGRDFKANEEFSIPESNILERDVQAAINSGLIVSLDGYVAKEDKSVRFVNLTNNTIVIGNTGIRVPANQKFYIPEAIIESMDVYDAIRSKIIAIYNPSLSDDDKKKNKPGRKKTIKRITSESEEDYNPFKKIEGSYIARPDLEKEVKNIDISEEASEDSFFVDKKQEKEKIKKLRKNSSAEKSV
jgi:hypothetical protein